MCDDGCDCGSSFDSSSSSCGCDTGISASDVMLGVMAINQMSNINDSTNYRSRMDAPAVSMAEERRRQHYKSRLDKPTLKNPNGKE